MDQVSKAPEALDDVKSVWQSKTVWAAIIMAIAPLIPPVGVFVAANPALVGVIAGGITAGLRMVTSKQVTLKKPSQP